MVDGRSHGHRNKKLVPSGCRPHIESDDLLIDILSRLPTKTLIQFRCVCKSWRDLISSSDFIKQHLRRSNDSRRHMLLFSIEPFQCIDIKALNDGVCQGRSKLGLPLSVGTTLKIVGSCNGLICLLANLDLVILWNPSTRDARFIWQNVVDLGNVTYYGFGYDSTIDDYKVIFGRSERDGTPATRVVMFQLKTKTWRSIDGLDYVNLIGQGCLINGALHWLEMKWEENVAMPLMPVLSSRVMSFGLTEETFQELIVLPYLSRDESYSSARIGITENRLLFLYFYSIQGKITMWVMKQYRVKESWTKVMQLSLTGIPQQPQTVKNYDFFNPVCILESGKVLSSDRKSMVLYDLKSMAYWIIPPPTPTELTLEPILYVESLVSPFTENR